MIFDMKKSCGSFRAGWAALALLAAAGAACAHPMGNFTVNHYSRLSLAPGTLGLHYVLDMAELPTITERQDMDKDGDSNITDAETRAYLADRTPKWLAQLDATVDGKPVVWAVKSKTVEFTAGVANLPVMRVELDAAAPLTPGRHAIAFEDKNYGARTGWKETVLDTARGVARPAGTDALKDVSRALRTYPESMLSAPLQVSKVQFDAVIPAPASAPPPKAPAKPLTSSKPVAAAKRPAAAKPAPSPVRVVPPAAPAAAPKPGAAVTTVPEIEAMLKLAPPALPAAAAPRPAAAPAAPTPKPVAAPRPAAEIVAPPAAVARSAAASPETRAPMSGSSSRWSRQFHNLVGIKKLSPGALALALLIAFFLGALHALQPGHGKTLVAAYLVGQRGTPKHALLLGLTVTITHTFGVFLLGAVALYASRYILPQDLFPWMGFASGVLIVALGAAMLYSRLRERPAHEHAHDHQHVQEHAHAAAGAAHAATHEHVHSHDAHDHAHEHTHPHEVRDDSHEHGHTHHHPHDHSHDHDHAHEHDHAHDGLTHSHGPFGAHTHAVPDQISLKSLIALGISGGIVPCWDALIVLLGAISLHRLGFGLLLIVAFSAGLATTLTAAGLAVVWGQNRIGMSRFTPERVRVVSMFSHAVIIVIGIVIAWQSLANGRIL
jgi:ABC-type nickel/cobalt efflux system permease component RcnA